MGQVGRVGPRRTVWPGGGSCIEGLKAQQTQIEALKSENGALQQQNQQFLERLAHLESMVEGMAKPSN
ncbi:MAG: hypothetical protein QGF67_15175 [Lentisphaeria bacterium]|nr:hypothetical protein [Lentisphaeria bacterium]